MNLSRGLVKTIKIRGVQDEIAISGPFDLKKSAFDVRDF